MLLPPTSSEADSTRTWQADNSQSDQRFRLKSVGLLQLCVGWATEVNYRSIAARSECCHETDLWSQSAWSRDASFIRAALASCRTTGDIQTVYSLCTSFIPDVVRRMSELVTSTSSIASRSRSVLRAVADMNSLRLVSNWASGALRSPALQRGTHFPHHSMK